MVGSGCLQTLQQHIDLKDTGHEVRQTEHQSADHYTSWDQLPSENRYPCDGAKELLVRQLF